MATQGVLREIYIIESKPLPADAVIGSFQLRVIPHDSLPKNGPGLAANGNFVLSAVEIYLGDELLPLVSASGTHAQNGYPVSSLIDDDPGTGWAINVSSRSAVKMNSEHIVWLTLGRSVAAQGRRLKLVMKHELNNHYNVGRFQLSWSTEVADGFTDPMLRKALATASEQRTRGQRQAVNAAFSAVDVTYKEARGRVDSLRQKLGLGPPAKTMVMRELPERRQTYIFTRGDFLRPDKAAGVVEPDVFDVLPQFSASETNRPRNRLDYAKWLVSGDNPLTPRVTVNRIWMRLFGRGLVETENDFGAQGSPPSHPELLDWLARQFIANHWSQKKLLRLIVTSATYRQSSHIRDDIGERDPRNVLLARQNRLRLDAEIVRDVALSASGTLSPKIGGPSVHPPQPDGVYAFTQNRKKWQTATGDARYRRAMYTMFYRSAPYPTLTTFDSPDFQSVCTRRVRSNTPLQALTMANDEAMFELARDLSARVLRSEAVSDRDEPRVSRLFTICYSRGPSARELDSVNRFLQNQRESFAADRDAASRLVGVRDNAEHATDVVELAAWTSLARAIMNTDEFITRE